MPYQPKQSPSFNKLFNRLEPKMSEPLQHTKLKDIKTFSKLTMALTDFLRQHQVPEPQNDFETPSQLGDFLEKHNLLIRFVNEFGKESKKLDAALHDPNVKKVAMKPIYEYLFNMMDINNNGKVSSTELLVFLAVNLHNDSKFRNELIFKKLDTNKNCALDLQEFEKYFLLQFKMMAFSAILKDLVFIEPVKPKHALDIDGMMLNNIQSDFAERIHPILNQFEIDCKAKLGEVQQLAKKCFDSMDKNHDGALSLDELQNKFTDGFFSTKSSYIRKTYRVLMGPLFGYLLNEQEAMYQAKTNYFRPHYSRQDPHTILDQHTPHFDSL